MVLRILLCLGMLLFLSGCAHTSKVVDDDPIVGRWTAPGRPGQLVVSSYGRWAGTGSFAGSGNWTRFWDTPPPPWNSIDTLLMETVQGTRADRPPRLDGKVVELVPAPTVELACGLPSIQPGRAQAYAFTGLANDREVESGPEFYMAGGQLIVTFRDGSQIELARDSARTAIKPDPIEGRWHYRPERPGEKGGSIHFKPSGALPGTGEWKGTGRFAGTGWWQETWPGAPLPFPAVLSLPSAPPFLESLLSKSPGMTTKHLPVIDGKRHQAVPYGFLARAPRADSGKLAQAYYVTGMPTQPGAQPEFYLVDGSLIVTLNDDVQLTLTRK